MGPNLDDALRKGLAHHQAGQLGDAERIYREILASNPNHAPAWHLLGTIAHQAGQSDVGAQMIEKAISLGLRSVEVFNNLGECYRCLRQFPMAIKAYQAGLSLKSDHAETLSNLGLTLSMMGRNTEALPFLDSAVRVDPQLANAHYNYGVALGNVGRHDDAIAQWEQTLKLAPNHPQAMKNLGLALTWVNRASEAASVLGRLVEKYPQFAEGHADYSNALAAAGRFDEAIAAAKRAVELAPERAEAYHSLGTAYMHASRFDDALVELKRAIDLSPSHLKSILSIAQVHLLREDFDQATDWFERAIALEPANVDAALGLSASHYQNRRIKESRSVLERALRNHPDSSPLHFNHAITLLTLGQYGEGFEEYEWRDGCRDFRTQLIQKRLALWNGESPSGRDIEIIGEQGLGSMIQFARYIRLILENGANVTVQVPEEIRSLIDSINGVSRTILIQSSPSGSDLHIMLMSLPRIFKTTLETIPSEIPYLFADPGRVERWKPIINAHAHGLKVGIVWAGSPKPDPKRSATLKAMSALSDVPNISWYSLQVSEPRDQLKDAPAQMNILDLGKDLHDFAETAAVMTQLDLVITVDTAAAHLAGALGIKTWTMLMYTPDWRWMMEGETTPWYPTMRLFRQQVRNDWTSVIEQIRTELLKLVEPSR